MVCYLCMVVAICLYARAYYPAYVVYVGVFSCNKRTDYFSIAQIIASYSMHSNCWVAFASLLSLLSSSVLSQIPHDRSATCVAAMQEFFSVHNGGQVVPPFCHKIQTWFLSNVSYRINFTQSMVDDVCGSAICSTFFKTVLPPCSGFVSNRPSVYSYMVS